MEKSFLPRAFLLAATLAAVACSNDDTQSSSDSGTRDASGDAGGKDSSSADASMADDGGDDSGMDATTAPDGGDDAGGDDATTHDAAGGDDAGGGDATTHDAAGEDAAGQDASGQDASGGDGSTGTGVEAGSDAGSADGSTGTGTEAGTVCGYATTIMADHPLAYLRLDDSSGMTAADATGKGNTGTFKGGVTLGAPGAIASCPGETAVTLDGNSGWIDLGDKFGFTGSSPFSLEIWVNPSTINGEFRGVMTKNSTDGSSQRQGFDVFSNDGLQYGGALGFERYQNGASGYSAIGPNGTDAGTAAAPIVGTWMHIVAVYDGMNQMIYTNGALAAGPSPSSEMIQTQTGCSFAVGALSCGSSGYFAGTLDEVAVYDTALSAAQVQAHYQAAQAASGVVIISPASGSTVSGPVLFQVTASESVGVNQVQLWDNGNKLGAYPNADPNATWQYFTHSYTLSSGAHQTTVLDLDNSYKVINQTIVNYTVQ